MRLELPGSREPYEMGAPRTYEAVATPATSRVAYAAVHVVADPLGSGTELDWTELDWEGTLAFRRHLWAHGLGVAEAMDTAQRGMGLGWKETRELIKRAGAAAQEFRRTVAATPGPSPTPGALVCGAGTDQLEPGPAGLDAIIAAYEEQLAVIENAGAGPVIMASRQLAASAAGPDDYAHVYGTLLRQVSRPVILHWLGPMFDPALTGYWGSDDLDRAAETVLAIIEEHAANVDGIKVSLLDADREIALRKRLPAGVRMYTGDDFNYPDLIRGGSDALLGIFDPIAAPAAAALRALDDGDLGTYEKILAPTVPLARHLFAAPTYFYKTGVVFLAWLAGHQTAFRLVGGYESARPVPHLVELFTLADAAGLFPDPDLAASRMRAWLEVNA